MAIKTEWTGKDFYTKFRNGDTFAENPTYTTEFLQDLVGNDGQFIETIKVTVIINENEVIPFVYTDLGGGVSQFELLGFDFKLEGLAVSQVVDIKQGIEIGEATISAITGTGNSILKFDNTNLGWLSDGEFDDIVICVKTAPTYLRYLYGINPSTFSAPNFTSPYDGSTQAYVLPIITGSLQTLTKVGSLSSWNLTDSLQARFVATTNTYTHEFEIVHQFRTAGYIEEELGNLDPVTNPPDLVGLGTRKYVNRFEFGYNSTAITVVFQDNWGTIGSGNVGWYEEALNGGPDIYTVDSVTITNASATGVIEVTETNSVSVVITASSAVFTATQRVIIEHIKLAAKSEYAEKTDTNATVFVRDSHLQDAGDPPAGSGIITNADVTQDSTTQITVDFDISFTTAEQFLLNEVDQYMLSITVGDQSLTAVTEQPVKKIIAIDNYTKNGDDTGLITNQSISITDTFNSFAGSKVSTDIEGWNADWYAAAYRFRLVQSSGEAPNVITAGQFNIIATDGTTEFIIKSKTIPFELPLISAFSPYQYHVFNIDAPDEFTIPTTDDLNIINFSSFNPGVAQAFQDVNGQLSFKIPWRDWIANDAVPAEFFDVSEPQNNRNEKTSNYSGVLSYEVFVELQLDILRLETGNTTTYKLRSDQCRILDFDDDDGAGFTATFNYYDLDNLPANNLYIDEEVRIEIEFDHSSGTLSEQDLWGVVWIEIDGSTQQPWHLSTFKDWTNPLNPLQPTDTLATGNTQFVEMVSILDKVTLICKTNRENLSPDTTYRIGARLGKQT